MAADELGPAQPVPTGSTTKAAFQSSRTRPVPLDVIAENIPQELRDCPQWIGWRYEEVEDRNGEKTWTKVPIDLEHGCVKASSTDPKTWTTFDKAMKRYLMYRNLTDSRRVDGVGFVFTKDDPYSGVDLDDAYDAALATPRAWAAPILADLNSYAEISPSKTGVKLWVKAMLPELSKHKDKYKEGEVEIYDRGRYFAVTGQRFAGTLSTVEDRQEQVDGLCRLVFGDNPTRSSVQQGANNSTSSSYLSDDEVIEKALAASNGDMFADLWAGNISRFKNDDSGADQSLCNKLAFWCGKDTNQMDRLFRQSGLMRPKWDEMRGDRTYGAKTIQEAVDKCREVYKRKKGKRKSRQAVRANVAPATAAEAVPSANGCAPTPPSSYPDHPTAAPAPPPIILTNYEERTVTENGEQSTVRIGLSSSSISRCLFAHTDNWPKRVAGRLFAASNFAPLWLDKTDSLFAWIGHQVSPAHISGIDWRTGPDMVRKSEFASFLEQTAEVFDAVETQPHEPTVPKIYYLHPPLPSSDGTALAELLKRFCPATEVDRALFHAMLLTPFWGGAPGQRPAFLLESEDDDPQGGRGVGKSKNAQAIARLVGGHIEFRPGDDIEKVVKRLLSPEGANKRIALLDNVKTLKFSWADLEGIITANIISGFKMYEGEGQRPNLLTWFITLNKASLSRDMAQRCVPIKLKRPEHNPTWESDTFAFIDNNRQSIIADIIAELRRPVQPLTKFSRWSAWEAAVLARVGHTEKTQKMIAERQGSIDEDDAEADVVRLFFIGALTRRGHNLATQAVKIPSKIAADWVNMATGERRPINKACAFLRTLTITELRKTDTSGWRGWTWNSDWSNDKIEKVPLDQQRSCPSSQESD